MKALSAIPQELFFTKNDPADPRLGEFAKNTELINSEFDFYILGYPDDEGIKNNGGRVGASSGPQLIRTALYKMTPSILNPVKKLLGDLGNLKTDIPLMQRHPEAQKIVFEVLKQNKKMITLGGGHDYGYPDAAAMVEYCLQNQLPAPLILNFDAHLDVRPFSDNKINSGTPFYRLLDQYSDHCHFIEIGIQNQCNSFEHLKWLQSKKGECIFFEDILEQGLEALLNPFLKKYSHHPIWISLDIDVFAQSDAPGCSQSWPVGLSAFEFMKTFKHLIKNHSVLGLGVYEVSPPLDVDSRTSKLAAQIIHSYIFESQELKKD